MLKNRIFSFILALVVLSYACNFPLPSQSSEADVQISEGEIKPERQATEEEELPSNTPTETVIRRTSTPTPDGTAFIVQDTPTTSPSPSVTHTFQPTWTLTPSPTRTSTKTPTATATETIEFGILPSLPPPALLTSFTAGYDNFHMCPGDVAVAVFRVTNTGGTILESTRIHFTDLDDLSMFWTRTSNNPFSPSSGGCPKEISKLGPGVSAYVIVQIPLATSFGHIYRAEMSLCTGENVSGVCAAQTIYYRMEHP